MRVGDGERDGVPERDAVIVDERLGVPDLDGVPDGVPERVPVTEGVRLGVPDGDAVTVEL